MNDEQLIHDVVKHQKEICPVKKPMPEEKKDIIYFDYENDLGSPNPKYNDPIKQREL